MNELGEGQEKGEEEEEEEMENWDLGNSIWEMGNFLFEFENFSLVTCIDLILIFLDEALDEVEIPFKIMIFR